MFSIKYMYIYNKFKFKTIQNPVSETDIESTEMSIHILIKCMSMYTHMCCLCLFIYSRIWDLSSYYILHIWSKSRALVSVSTLISVSLKDFLETDFYSTAMWLSIQIHISNMRCGFFDIRFNLFRHLCTKIYPFT